MKKFVLTSLILTLGIGVAHAIVIPDLFGSYKKRGAEAARQANGQNAFLLKMKMCSVGLSVI